MKKFHYTEPSFTTYKTEVSILEQMHVGNIWYDTLRQGSGYMKLVGGEPTWNEIRCNGIASKAPPNIQMIYLL